MTATEMETATADGREHKREVSSGSGSAATAASASKTWLRLAEDEISRLKLNPELLEVLRAFGGDDHAPGPATLDPDDVDDSSAFSSPDLPDGDGEATDDNRKLRDHDDLPSLISSSLLTEIDPDQSRMFARRFASVSSLLASQNTPTSSLLRLGLYRRARQILSVDPPPRALRIRALVDFVWSQALVLGNAERLGHLPSLDDLVHGRNKGEEVNGDGEGTGAPSSSSSSSFPLHYREFAPGMFHRTIEGETSGGPVHVNVLRIRNGAATMRTVDARTDGHTTDLAQLASESGAAAAVSGGFFLYSEPDIESPSRRTDPVGLLVTDGDVVWPPAFRRAALMQDGTTGTFVIDRVGMEGVTVRIGDGGGYGDDGDGDGGSDGDGSLTLVVGADGVRCVHRGDAKEVSLEYDQVGISVVGRKVFRISKTPSDGGSGGGGDKEGANSSARTIKVPLAGFVLVVPTNLIPSDDSSLREDAPVSYRLPPSRGAVRAGMAGGPILLADPSGSLSDFSPALELRAEDFRGTAPPVTFSQDETFDRNLLPRMGAGLTSEGDLVFAAVDGRNLDRALGLTLRGTAELLESLGCVTAMNLDGGSSKRMVVRDRGVVCLSTTEIKASSSSHGPATKDATAEDDKGTDESQATAVASSPEPTRPVHSAILFLPREELSSKI